MSILPATVLLQMSRDLSKHLFRRDSSWYGFSEGSTWGAIPFAVSNLYRGQNMRYQSMLPSISRGLTSSESGEVWRYSITDQAKIVLRLAQSWWFAYEVDRHPIKRIASNQKLEFNDIALAQHYGIPTGYLDLSDDFNVSAFFATCRETKTGWEPVDTGIGVIYKVDLRKPGIEADKYAPLGPQNLPRPSEQSAWVVELPFCHSFEDWQEVSMMQFHQDRHVGEYYLEMFSGGERLFPIDPLKDVADEILTCGEIPENLAVLALESLAEDPYGIRSHHVQLIRNELTKLTTPINYRRLLTDQQISLLLADTEWREKMLKEVKVNWRAVRRVPVNIQDDSQE